MWLPGIGTVSGFDAKNWLNSNYTGALVVDQQVGSASSSSPAGTIGVAQATAGSRPLLRQSGDVYSWEFDGTDDRLTLSAAPFSAPSDHVLLVGCTPTTSASTKTIFSIRNGGSGRVELSHTTANRFQCEWSVGTTAIVAPPAVIVDTPAVVTCQYAANIASVRINGAHAGDLPHVPPTLSFTQNHIGATNGGAFANHYKGKLHGVILIKANITHAEKVVLEQFLATVSGTTVSPDKVRTYVSLSSMMAAYMGGYTLSSGVYRMAQNNGALFMRITAEKAEMYCSSGDTTPYRVLVDSQDFAGSASLTALDAYGVAATLSTNVTRIPLFSGAQGTRDVIVFSENSGSGQQFGNSVHGALLALTGDNVSAAPRGTIWYCADPAFPGVITNSRVAQAATLPAFDSLTNGPNWGNANLGSVHFRAKFQELHVFTANQSVEVSIDGGAFQRYELSPRWSQAGVVNRNWRTIPISGNGSTLQSVIIAGAGDPTSRGLEGVITGIMLSGASVDLQAPTGTRRHVVQFGASQTEGVGANGLIDLHLVQDRLPIYALSAGVSGKSVRTAVEDPAPNNFDSWAATVTNKDILLISMGINDITDMPTYQANYQILIGKALAAGFNKVICRGLGFPAATFADKNARIAAAVTAVADARVVYASVDTWTDAGLNDVHPTRDGYLIMAANSVRDHAALYV